MLEKSRMIHNRRGAMLPLIAVVFVILLVAAALSIDIAKMHMTRCELRTATDAAAKAAMEALGREQSISAARSAGIAAARRNSVDGVGLDLASTSMEFGVATARRTGDFEFRPAAGADIVNAVRVIGSRTNGSPNGPVNLLFGSFFGVHSFQPQQVATAARSDRDISLVLDVSGSMLDFAKFPAMQNALDVFLRELDSSPQEERVSLTVYGTTGRKLVNLTDNLNQIRTAFSTQIPAGFTAIGSGLRLGLDSQLNDPGRRPFALRSIIVMTDGMHNRGVDPEVIAADCATNRIEVHTVTFGSDADRRRMQDVARITRGIHFHANSNQELIDQFRIIALQLKTVLVE
jgi:Ca-activated chloride channel homolog